jgi:hypothetical protein
VPEKSERESAVKRVEGAGGVRILRRNPYCDVSGVRFEGPEGCRF